MPTTVAITNANGTLWSLASTDTPSNTALAARMHDLGFLTEGSSTTFAQARPGVLAGAGLTAANTPNSLFVSPTGTGLTVQVNAGGCVLERGTFSGPGWSTFTPAGTYPYVGALKSTVTFTANTANSLSGTRIDRVDLQMADGPGYSDNSGTSFAQIIYTAGTVGSGVAANAPSNSIPLALITFPSGTTTTLTSGMFTDMRRSTSLRGAPRVLMGGDALADAGFTASEERWRFHATYGWLRDYWDATNSVWRGTEEILLPQPAQVASGSLASAATVTMSSVVVTDPGFPFHIEGFALADFASGTQGTVLQVALQINSATFGTNKFASDQEPAVAANINFDLGASCFGNTKVLGAAMTGGQTVYFVAKNSPGPSGAASITIYTNFYGFVLKIIPATV